MILRDLKEFWRNYNRVFSQKEYKIKPWKDTGDLVIGTQVIGTQSEKVISYKIPITWHSGKRRTMGIIKRSVVAEDERAGRDEQAEHRPVKLFCMVQ